MAYCLRSFVETLDQVLNPHQHYTKWVLDHNHRPQIQSLFENATFLQDFLDKSSPEIQETISSLEDRIMDAAQKAADTLETYIVLFSPRDQEIPISHPDMEKVIRVFEEAKQEASRIMDLSQTSDHIVSPPVSLTRYPESKMVVGLENDLGTLRNRLTSAQVNKLDVIPIVGMGGIGKTTLARLLYDEYSSKSHFDRCAWVTVSQRCDPQQILKTILACVTKKPLKEIPNQETNELVTTLYQTLVGRRYLIVLDDIWSYKAWDDVQRAFARDNSGSRIILTTRDNSLVDYVKSNGHEMHLINEEKSWELLRRKVFGDQSCPRELEWVGYLIAVKCGGLPLALQVIGGLLAHSRISNFFWEYVAQNISSFIAEIDDQFAGIFSCSFTHLPHYLKPCFLYMAAFPEDSHIPASKLIKLWVAEGFLRPVPNKSLEEAAEIYLNALVNRNLIFVRTRGRSGNAKWYGIHDILRDLCLRKAQEKKFLYVKDLEFDILQEATLCLRRVSVHSSYDEDAEYDYGSLKLAPLARSFLLSGYDTSKGIVSHLCYKSSLLRVLDVKWLDCEDVPLHLINLRYLCNYRLSIADDFCVLKNLQILVVWNMKSLAILEHLPHLRHLKFHSLEDRNNTYSLEISPHQNLQYLTRVPLNNVTCLAVKFPNLKNLGIDTKGSSYESAIDLSGFQKLENLKFCVTYSSTFTLSSNMILPLSLKKLKFGECKISQTLNAIGNHPGLQVLVLRLCEFENGTWEPSEGEFCQLQYLEISFSGLEKWLATEVHFPVLQHLVLRNCDLITEIPNDIGRIETLETIEVDVCKASVFNSANAILEEQLEFGNTHLRLRLGRSTEEIENERAAKQLKTFESEVENHELTLVGYGFVPKTSFPHTLRYLMLEDCTVRQTILSAIGVLPDLQVLKLNECEFEDSTWKTSESEFRQLRHLQILNAKNLVQWLPSETHFPVLWHLVINQCYDLIGIPIGIGRIEDGSVVGNRKRKVGYGEVFRYREWTQW